MIEALFLLLELLLIGLLLFAVRGGKDGGTKVNMGLFAYRDLSSKATEVTANRSSGKKNA